MNNKRRTILPWRPASKQCQSNNNDNDNGGNYAIKSDWFEQRYNYNGSLTFGNFIDLSMFDVEQKLSNESVLSCNTRNVNLAQEKNLYLNEIRNGDVRGYQLKSYDEKIKQKLRNYRNKRIPKWRPLLCFTNLWDKFRHEREWDVVSIDIHGNDKFLLEIDRSLSGCCVRHANSITPLYIQSAQNYAIYGVNFFDFPKPVYKSIPSRLQPNRYYQKPRNFSPPKWRRVTYTPAEPATFNLNNASFPPLPLPSNKQ